jgi:acyl dehydratase
MSAPHGAGGRRPTRAFEDFYPGQEIDLGTCTVTEDEIVAFARQFDPQPFHVDRAAAAE